MDTIIVQVQFEAETAYGKFRDALNIPSDEYDLLSQVEIDDMKQARIDKWVAYMKNPPASKPETKSEAQSRASELSKMLTELNAKIAGM